MEPPLDTEIEVVTPENVAFSYRLAGPFTRAAAFAIDFIIRVKICVAFFFSATPFYPVMQESLVGVMLVLAFLLEWTYGLVFEGFMYGQTPGKRALGLRVVTVDGQPITVGQAFLRNVLRLVDLLPMGSGMLGLAAATSTPRMQRLGDLAAGTMVVSEKIDFGATRLGINDPKVRDFSHTLPESFPVSRLLAKALSLYVARRGQLSTARRREVASRVAEPLARLMHLPPETDPDLLLCGLHYRTFLRRNEEAAAEAARPLPSDEFQEMLKRAAK